MFISLPEVEEAERLSKAQRIAAGRWLRVDESKITSSRDMLLLRGIRGAAAEQSAAFNSMLQDMDVIRLFNDGALYFDRGG
jgi:hypothetical protein